MGEWTGAQPNITRWAILGKISAKFETFLVDYLLDTQSE